MEISIIMKVLVLCWRTSLLYALGVADRTLKRLHPDLPDESGVGAARATMLEAMYALPRYKYRSHR